jgi:hypothetical protein
LKTLETRPEPVEPKVMRYYGADNSICRELRIIYQLLDGNRDQEARFRLRVAMAMAKKMNAALLNKGETCKCRTTTKK